MVLDVTAVLVGIASVLSAAELLALRAEFRRNGVFDPQVLSSTRPGVLTARLGVVAIPRIAGAELALAVTVMLLLALGMSPVLPLVGLAAAMVLQRFLIPYGGDGSDDMARVLTVTLAVAYAVSTTSAAVRIALVFIAAQLCLAYGASGISKLFGGTWRSGTAVPRILHTAFGHAGLTRSALDRWPNAGKTITWLVIAFEVAFPIGIVLGGWFAAAALAGAAAFQLSIAISMGLNRFTPWFVAAFPATAWTACHYGLFS